METIKILSTRGDILFESKEAIDLADAVEQAVSMSVSLIYANLQGTNLQGASLAGANLQGANLQYASLQYAGLRYANLREANLEHANLKYASLHCADLSGANLWNANLWDVNLREADLSYANLEGANLWNATLVKANLDKVSTNKHTTFFESLCPSEGSFVGWKKAGAYIVKLLITEDAKRSSATSLKCRCSKAKVLDIQDIEGKSLKDEIAVSNYDRNFIYKVGKIVEVDDFDEDRWSECSTGIHFFLARNNAVQYS